MKSKSIMQYIILICLLLIVAIFLNYLYQLGVKDVKMHCLIGLTIFACLIF